MIKKIRSSLWLKIFLAMTALLFTVSFLIYGIVMAVMPSSYKSLVTSGYTKQISQLVSEVEGMSTEDATDAIYTFCMEYNAAAHLEGNTDSLSFGGGVDQKAGDAAQIVTASLSLKDGEYTLTISTPAKLINQIQKTFLNLIPMISLAIIVLSLIGAYFTSRLLTKPVIEISDISKRLAVMDMTWRCSTKRTDEVGVLAVNLNTMAGRLEEALKGLTEANEKLQADIEQERRQEKLRVDFFRAVSHELKTPITILKGELEGMIYQVGEYKDRDASLRQTMRTVKEMEALVQEILSSSRMAESDFSLSVAEFDLRQLVRDCCRKWQGVSEDKNQQFLVTVEESCPCQGDAALLKKALSNIIGNAVAYSPKQAAVSVSLQGKTLEVKNSGVSIAPASLEQIFEPFYRVDDSRNREIGGSGLGLYIVKAVLERHGLQYHMTSTDQEVCFTIHF